jgi:hypothetical protein
LARPLDVTMWNNLNTLCLYVCICIRVLLHAYILIQIYKHIPEYIHKYVLLHIHTYTNTNVCMNIYIQVYTHICVCTHVYIYTMRMWQIRKTPWQNGCWCWVWIIRNSQSSKLGIVQRNEYTRHFDCP